MKRDFVSIADCDRECLEGYLAEAASLKDAYTAGIPSHFLAGQSVAMIFEKPSLRTRLSFEAGVTQLGGHAIYLTRNDIGLGKREPVRDVARVLSSMVQAVVARTFEHDTVVEMARYASIPVINALTDFSHPCQAMADLMTAREVFGRLAGLKLAFIGDGNNVARSLAVACGRFDMAFQLAAPDGHRLDDSFVARLAAQCPGMRFSQSADPAAAVAGAHVVYTDTWVSMGQEDEREQRLTRLAPYQVNAAMMAKAPAEAVVMHCLPAYRGQEITEEVLESEQSVVFQQAENRLHFQKGLLKALMCA
ncbi:MAG: Ornithine carbamoyltransferase [Phycisphaerae bacterium]|nr:Ornithine carbamoyltransferase [Phycisphaerae bacterium]